MDVVSSSLSDSGLPAERTDHAPANCTTIKHMAYNLLRHASTKGSLGLRRKVAAWDGDFLAPCSRMKIHPIATGNRMGYPARAIFPVCGSIVNFATTEPSGVVMLNPIGPSEVAATLETFQVWLPFHGNTMSRVPGH